MTYNYRHNPDWRKQPQTKNKEKQKKQVYCGISYHLFIIKVILKLGVMEYSMRYDVRKTIQGTRQDSEYQYT